MARLSRLGSGDVLWKWKGNLLMRVFAATGYAGAGREPRRASLAASPWSFPTESGHRETVGRAERAETALDAERTERRILTDRLTAVQAQPKSRSRTPAKLPDSPAA
jgi:hypothetical protein